MKTALLQVGDPETDRVLLVGCQRPRSSGIGSATATPWRARDPWAPPSVTHRHEVRAPPRTQSQRTEREAGRRRQVRRASQQAAHWEAHTDPPKEAARASPGLSPRASARPRSTSACLPSAPRPPSGGPTGSAPRGPHGGSAPSAAANTRSGPGRGRSPRLHDHLPSSARGRARLSVLPGPRLPNGRHSATRLAATCSPGRTLRPRGACAPDQ